MDTPSQEAPATDPLLGQCWVTVYNAGSTLTQQWVNVACLLGHIPCKLMTHTGILAKNSPEAKII